MFMGLVSYSFGIPQEWVVFPTVLASCGNELCFLQFWHRTGREWVSFHIVLVTGMNESCSLQFWQKIDWTLCIAYKLVQSQISNNIICFNQISVHFFLIWNQIERLWLSNVLTASLDMYWSVDMKVVIADFYQINCKSLVSCIFTHLIWSKIKFFNVAIHNYLCNTVICINMIITRQIPDPIKLKSMLQTA